MQRATKPIVASREPIRRAELQWVGVSALVVPIIPSRLVALALLMLLSSACSREPIPVVVHPGKSINGVALGMSRDEVASLLGRPSQEVDSQHMGTLGEFRVLGGEQLVGDGPPLTVFRYENPPLDIVVDDEEGVVSAVQVWYTPSLRVEGYEFMNFQYLTGDSAEGDH